MSSTNHSLSAVALAVVCCTGAAQAQALYVGGGLPGAQIGYTQSLGDSYNLRLDHITLGTYSDTVSQSGTDYQVKLGWSRTALLFDWYLFPYGSSSFRLTAGINHNNMGFTFKASGSGSTVDIAGNTYTLGASDTLTIKVQLPENTPYVGIGWGHKPLNKGWGFYSDVGLSLGRFKVSEARTGELANGGNLGVTQAQMDDELRDMRETISKIVVLPHLTFGTTYRF